MAAEQTRELKCNTGKKLICWKRKDKQWRTISVYLIRALEPHLALCPVVQLLHASVCSQMNARSEKPSSGSTKSTKSGQNVSIRLFLFISGMLSLCQVHVAKRGAAADMFLKPRRASVRATAVPRCTWSEGDPSSVQSEHSGWRRDPLNSLVFHWMCQCSVNNVEACESHKAALFTIRKREQVLATVH